MFRAIGTVIVIWYLSSIFSQSFSAFDSMLSASFNALEAAADASKVQFVK